MGHKSFQGFFSIHENVTVSEPSYTLVCPYYFDSISVLRKPQAVKMIRVVLTPSNPSVSIFSAFFMLRVLSNQSLSSATLGPSLSFGNRIT